MVYTCISSPSSADLDVCMSVPGPVPDVPYDWFTRACVFNSHFADFHLSVPQISLR
jgi:hypothetical protein